MGCIHYLLGLVLFAICMDVDVDVYVDVYVDLYMDMDMDVDICMSWRVGRGRTRLEAWGIDRPGIIIIIKTCMIILSIVIRNWVYPPTKKEKRKKNPNYAAMEELEARLCTSCHRAPGSGEKQRKASVPPENVPKIINQSVECNVACKPNHTLVSASTVNTGDKSPVSFQPS